MSGTPNTDFYHNILLQDLPAKKHFCTTVKRDGESEDQKEQGGKPLTADPANRLLPPKLVAILPRMLPQKYSLFVT